MALRTETVAHLKILLPPSFSFFTVASRTNAVCRAYDAKRVRDMFQEVSDRIE